MESKSYTEMNVWKVARQIANEIYSVTQIFPKDEIFGITNQMRRAAVSIASNIAEGIGRNHSKDTLQFLYISRGSVYELETQLFISLDQNFISQNNFDEILILITDCKKLLNGTINYYRNRS
jgi:four helix bundle protein